MTATGYAHIELRDGVPYIAGTQAKVRLVVQNKLAYGWDGDEIQRNLPYLTLAQVYAALAYYYDHKDEIDRDIEEQRRRAEELRPTLENPDVRARMMDAKQRRTNGDR